MIEPPKNINHPEKGLDHKDIETDFHHYAYDEKGDLIYIQEKEQCERKDYKCLACGEIMRPVMGNHNEWHFRHKNSNPSCNKESYLHLLAKKLIKNRFDNNDTFPIAYYRKESCPQIDHCAQCSPKCSRINKHTINLKEIYDTCEAEETDGKNPYRADLKLSNSKKPKCKPIFIEVSYSHDCETEKINSGIQIIELKINNEADILQPLEEQQLMLIDTDSSNPYQFCEVPPVRFYNFERNVRQKTIEKNCYYAKAKKELKNIFEKSGTFPITYKGFSKCSLFGSCSLSSPECNKKIVNITKDLKAIYDMCSEDKNGNIVLSNTKTDFQPLIFKLSFDGQTGYEEGKRIVEFKQYKDVKRDLAENELLHIDLSCPANPYKDTHSPTTRFYNFERTCNGLHSIQLRRFVVVRKDGKLFCLSLDPKYNVSCDIVYELPQETIYELLIPESYSKTLNIRLFGMIKAKLSGIDIRDCCLCRHCHTGRNGCVRYGNFMYNLLDVKEIDKGEECRKCRYYSVDLQSFSSLIQHYKHIPCREWIRR